MAANKGNAALQYTMKKKNRTNVVIIVLFTILVVIVCYKLQRRFTQKSGSDSDGDGYCDTVDPNPTDPCIPNNTDADNVDGDLRSTAVFVCSLIFLLR